MTSLNAKVLTRQEITWQWFDNKDLDEPSGV
jgi:hypothetical protein